MALVAYDQSDSDSDVYEEDANTITTANVNKITEEPVKVTEELLEPAESSDIFKSLPPKRQRTQAIEEDDDEFLQKKPAAVKQKAKITVPSLSDFKDVEDVTTNYKPNVNSGKKSGLLGLLPEPRNVVKISTNSLVPNVLRQKPNVTKPVISAPKVTSPSKTIGIEYSDEDSDNEDTDFFSINKKHDLPEIHEEIPKPVEEVPEVPEVQYAEPIVEENMVQDYVNDEDTQGNAEPLELDDEAIRQLCGSRGRRKKEEIQFLHIDQGEVLAEAQEVYQRQLLEDTSKHTKRTSVKKKGNEPTNLQKRKHQITYLAHQAKANEAELQNQWANNRMSRRQTQSKYGF